MVGWGTGSDLHPDRFAPNRVALTTYGHLTVTLDRRQGPAVFDLHVMRGFAVALFEQLSENAAEYGYRLAD